MLLHHDYGNTSLLPVVVLHMMPSGTVSLTVAPLLHTNTSQVHHQHLHGPGHLLRPRQGQEAPGPGPCRRYPGDEQPWRRAPLPWWQRRRRGQPGGGGRHMGIAPLQAAAAGPGPTRRHGASVGFDRPFHGGGTLRPEMGGTVRPLLSFLLIKPRTLVFRRLCSPSHIFRFPSSSLSRPTLAPRSLTSLPLNL